MKEVPEYFDVEDEDEADEEGVDDVQVGKKTTLNLLFTFEHVQHLGHGLFKVSEDPFASVEITALESQERKEENSTDDFCDVCGQSLPSEQVYM